MSGLSKLGVVLAGYVTAFLLAWAFLYVRGRLIHIDPAQASGGMQAFGDLILFAGVFGFLALVPTALALYYLRPYAGFWTAFSIVSLLIALTGPLAAALMRRVPQPHSAMVLVQFIGLLRMFGAPVLGLGFGLAALAAPARRPRSLLISAALIEGLVTAYAIYSLFVLRSSVMR